jgi:hypothetical protein
MTMVSAGLNFWLLGLLLAVKCLWVCRCCLVLYVVDFVIIHTVDFLLIWCLGPCFF